MCAFIEGQLISVQRWVSGVPGEGGGKEYSPMSPMSATINMHDAEGSLGFEVKSCHTHAEQNGISNIFTKCMTNTVGLYSSVRG